MDRCGLQSCALGFLLAVLAPTAAAASPAVEASFARHAQIEGDTHAGGLHWAFLVFDGSHSDAAFTFAWDQSGTLSNITHADGQYGNGSAPTVMVPWLDYPRNRTLPGPVRAQLGFVKSWGSLYIEAENLELDSNGTRIDTDRIFDGDDLRTHLSTVKMPLSATNYPPMLPGNGVALSLANPEPEANFRFQLKASGIHYLAWHNATIACTTASCPDAGRSWRITASPTVPFWAALNPYISVTIPGGTVRGSGTSLVGVAGGSLLDVQAHGALRLTEADLKGRCPKGPCPNPAGRTFLASGDLTLSALEPDADAGRLHTHLTGAFATAAFDESPVSAFRLGVAAAAGLGLLGVLVLLKYAWGRFFVRSARPAALESPRRRAVFEAMQAEPGISFRDLQRRLGWPHGTLRNHVQRLLEARVIVAHRHRNTVRYFENHGRFDKKWLPTAHLQDPDTRQLHEWLLAHPAVGQSQVTRETHGWGWTRAKTRRRLADLKEAGLLGSVKHGNRVRYQAQGPPEGGVLHVPDAARTTKNASAPCPP